MPFPRGCRLKKALFGSRSNRQRESSADAESGDVNHPHHQLESNSQDNLPPFRDGYQGDGSERGSDVVEDDVSHFGDGNSEHETDEDERTPFGSDSAGEWYQGNHQSSSTCSHDSNEPTPSGSDTAEEWYQGDRHRDDASDTSTLFCASAVEYQGDHQCEGEEYPDGSGSCEGSVYDSTGEWYQGDDAEESKHEWYVKPEDRDAGESEDDQIVDDNEEDQEWYVKPADEAVYLDLDASRDQEEYSETEGCEDSPNTVSNNEDNQRPKDGMVSHTGNRVEYSLPPPPSNIVPSQSSCDSTMVLAQRDAAIRSYKQSKHYPDNFIFTLSDLSPTTTNNETRPPSQASSTMSSVIRAAKKNKDYIDSIYKQLGVKDDVEDVFSVDVARKMKVGGGEGLLRSDKKDGDGDADATREDYDNGVVSDAEEVIDDLDEINEECLEQDSSFNLTQDDNHRIRKLETSDLGKDLPEVYREEFPSNPFKQDRQSRLPLDENVHRTAQLRSSACSFDDESPQLEPRLDEIYNNPFGPPTDTINPFGRELRADGRSKSSPTVGGGKPHERSSSRSSRPTSDGPAADKKGEAPAKVIPFAGLDGPITSVIPSSRFPSLEALGDFVNRKFRGTPKGTSILPAVSVTPVLQSSFYACLELTLQTTTSNFLAANKQLLDVHVLRREVHAWESGSWYLFDGTKQKRVRVVEFLFPLEVQVRLMDAHLSVFLKAEAFTPKEPTACRQAVRIISGWKSLVESLGRTTLCNPDWLLMEHLRGAERILGLLGDEHVSEEAGREWEVVKRRVVAAVMEKEIGFFHLPRDSRVEPMAAVTAAAKATPAPVKDRADHSYMQDW